MSINYLNKTGVQTLWGKIKNFFVKGNGKVFVGTCNAASTAVEKAVVCSNFTSADLVEGATISVSFDQNNTAAVNSVTLNVNNTGAKNIKFINNGAISNLPASTYIKGGQTYQFYYDGTYWIQHLNYNTNTNTSYTLYRQGGSYKVKTALYRYQILLTVNEQELLPINTVSNSTATNKTLTTQSFDPFGQIYYYNTTTTVAAGSTVATTQLYNQQNLRLDYSFNTGTTLTAHKAVYLVAVMQSDGKAKLHTAPISQILPTSQDGLIYIYLGRAYSTNQIQLDYTHPIYIYKNGACRLYTGYSAISGTSPISVSGTVVSHANSGVTAAAKGDTANQTPAFGGTFKALSGTVNATGHLTAFADHTVTIPNTAASTATDGLMSAADKVKLNGIATGATANTGTITGITTSTPLSGSGTSGSVSLSHANSGVTASTYGTNATTALTPAFNETFSVPGFVVNATGHITSATSHTVKIPNTAATTAAAGLMSADDKKKLNGIANNATANTGTITGITTTSPLSGSGTSGSVALSHANSGVTASTYGTLATAALTPVFGGTFNVPGYVVNATGHVTSSGNHTVKIPATAATTAVAGLMSAADKIKLNGIAEGAQVNVSYSAGSGLSLSGTTFSHSNSVTAATAGTSAATSGASLAVPYVTYDAQGHITASGTHTHTINSLAASAISSGTFATARIPSLPASIITSGTFATARVPSLPASIITSGTFATSVLPIVPIVKGGTGSSTAAAARTALGAAPLASPVFTGIPGAPTAEYGTSTTQLATTAFVQNAIGTGDANLFVKRTGDYMSGSLEISGAQGDRGLTIANGSIGSSFKTDGNAFGIYDETHTKWILKDDNGTVTLNGTASSADTLTGILPIAKGGTGASTRLEAAKNLTNENVGTSATHLVTLTTSWGKFGYTAIADARKVLGIYDSVTSRTANTVLAAPNGAAGTASFRALVAADIPNLAASKITSGQLAIARGGTNASTAAAARTNLGVKFTQLYTGNFKSGSTTFSLNYDAFLVCGHPGSTILTAVLVPKAMITTSNTTWMFSDELCYLAFNIKYSSATVTLAWNTNKDQDGKTLTTGAITKIYGING